MAYAALVSLSQILEQVTDGDQQHMMIKSLHEKSNLLQSFLEDYAYDGGEKVDPLEERIREAAYEAEDVIELHVLNRVRSEHSLVFKYRKMQNLENRYKKDLRRSNGNIDSISEEAMNIKMRYENETPVPCRSLGAGSSTQAPLTSRSTAVGFDDDLLEIVTRLCGESPKLQIISIVGMGGIGKTTLARNTFDDPLVAEYFHIRAWITISNEYSMRDILLSLLNTLNALDNDLRRKSNEILAEKVYKSLKGRRYLITMDDMWSTKAWDDIRRILPDDKNGSRIIITTRLSEVATYADSSSPLHHMKLLNEDQSWSLLHKKVFKKELCPRELEKIGKMTAKCGGLPLGIVLVAGLLSKVDAILSYWEKFELNVSSILARDDEHLFKILSLSYNNLPHHLRACFLYMGGLPEHSRISVSKLTMLWTAEGFLKPNISKSSEEMAEEYVGDLVNRNLVIITKKSSSGRIRFCRIHDLLSDFCIQKAHDENFLHVKKNGSAPQKDVGNKRRLSNSMNCSVHSKAGGLFVRSFLLSNNNYRYLTSLAVSHNLLRVLDGTNVQLTCIPAEITQLFHLRYLAFSCDYSARFVVPARIFKLRNLQTLIIASEYRYSFPSHFLDEPKIHLPPEIWKMPKLRHVISNHCCFSLPVPFSTNTNGKVPLLISSLQTLSKVANFSFAKETIEMIPNIKKLGVLYHGKGVNHVIKLSEYHLNNLGHLYQLESLNLICNLQTHWSRHKLGNPLTNNFALPLKLKKLSLTGCRISQKNLSIIVRSPNLEVLKLRSTGFKDDEWKLIEGEFLRLKFLLMESLDVKCWQVDDTHFPGLEHLIIKHCGYLEEIPSEIGEIPTLQHIEVVSGLKSARDSAIRIQEEQRSLGNESLQVYVLDPWPRSLTRLTLSGFSTTPLVL